MIIRLGDRISYNLHGITSILIDLFPMPLIETVYSCTDIPVVFWFFIFRRPAQHNTNQNIHKMCACPHSKQSKVCPFFSYLPYLSTANRMRKKSYYTTTNYINLICKPIKATKNKIEEKHYRGNISYKIKTSYKWY